ncbi:hypothetical protein SKAU_G00128500 [Synaphobranchus kaupii]|uniref:Uncharacterized protein n=1 Tax=Synaphobranchus kaupii TaxID=118154 RepID=A0A9Q1FQC2_SYNKA|nr:hypothetical protein SKAU_G00128500 [Synaphobranchus kaupii]
MEVGHLSGRRRHAGYSLSHDGGSQGEPSVRRFRRDSEGGALERSASPAVSFICSVFYLHIFGPLRERQQPGKCSPREVRSGGPSLRLSATEESGRNWETSAPKRKMGLLVSACGIPKRASEAPRS